MAHYVCNRRRASEACTNGLRSPVEDMNEAVLSAIEEHALTPEAVEAAVIAMRSDVSAKVPRGTNAQAREAARAVLRLHRAPPQGLERLPQQPRRADGRR